MTRYSRLAILIVAATMSIAACGGGDSATGPGQGGNANGGSGTITLRNESTHSILTVNISLCTNPSWGPNRLNASEVVEPGAERQWTMEKGCYDVRVSNGSKTASWYDRELNAGGSLNLAVTPSLDPSLAPAGGLGSLK